MSGVEVPEDYEQRVSAWWAASRRRAWQLWDVWTFVCVVSVVGLWLSYYRGLTWTIYVELVVAGVAVVMAVMEWQT